MSLEFKPTDFFVSTEGKDPNAYCFWSGKLPEPNADGTDGPFATILAARTAIRLLKQTAGITEPITVWIRGGRYFLQTPLTFGPEDSGPVTYAAYPGEEPIFDGGVQVKDWTKTKRNGIEVWTADVSAILPCGVSDRQLFVNGSRRSRARLPKEGFFKVESMVSVGSEEWPANHRLIRSFVCGKDDLTASHSLDQAEIVCLCGYIADRLSIASFYPDSRIVTVRPEDFGSLETETDVLLLNPHDQDIAMVEPRGFLSPGIYPEIDYYVENVPEAMVSPGQWYLDNATGQLYYIPMKGEKLEEIQAFMPCIPQLLLLCGDPDNNRYVEFLSFRGLAFEHTDWVKSWRSRQADHKVPGAIRMEGARNCAIEHCRVEHVGWYGIELADGCMSNRIVGNILADLGAGGVKLNGSDVNGSRQCRTGNNKITDNEIRNGGVVFHASIGILLMHSFGNEVSHNHIHDLFYGGISCGWTWGFGESVSRENRILKNHIHDIGISPWKEGLLADMGGIYTLGIQPGTTIKGNIIHDIFSYRWGYGIYLDAGSSHMLIEDNICWKAADESFHIHHGREHIVRNNIFALSMKGSMSLGRGQLDMEYRHCGANSSCAATMERNIMIADGTPFIIHLITREHELIEDHPFRSDMNLFWDISGKRDVWGGQGRTDSGLQKEYDAQAWRALGLDLASVFADPGFADLANRDFTLAADSPALAIGFRSIDVSDVGPRLKPGTQ